MDFSKKRLAKNVENIYAKILSDLRKRAQRENKPKKPEKMLLFSIFPNPKNPGFAPGFCVQFYTLKTRDSGFGFPGLRPLL